MANLASRCDSLSLSLFRDIFALLMGSNGIIVTRDSMDENVFFFFFFYGIERAQEEDSFNPKIYIVILTSRCYVVHGC